MNNAQEFVIKSIKKITQDFPFVQCTYQFDRFCGLHSVEILPKHYLNNVGSFGELQFNITKEFIALFPFERISFFSSGNSLEIEPEDVILTIKGKCFSEISKDVELFPDYKVNVSNFDEVIDRGGNYAVAA